MVFLEPWLSSQLNLGYLGCPVSGFVQGAGLLKVTMHDEVQQTSTV